MRISERPPAVRVFGRATVAGGAQRAATLIALAALLGAAGPAAAQDLTRVEPPAANAVYVEVLGNALFYSVNYDRRFSPVAGARVGIGWIGAAGAIPVTFNFTPGGTRHHFELAAGPLLFFAPTELESYGEGDLVADPDASFTLLGTGTVGYRLQPDSGGLVFRVGFTPLFSFTGLLPWAGLSVGYAF